MNKLLLAAASCAAALALSAPAQAAVVDSINLNATPAVTYWVANNVGWYYTPDSSYTLTGIGSKFGSSGGTVTASLYSGTVGSLTLLASGTLSTVAGAFADATLGPVSLTAGTTYFFSFSDVAGQYVNVTQDAGAENLGALRYDFGGAPGTFDSSETGFTAQPIVRFLGAGAVPEPASWAMMIGGFAIAGAAMRRRPAAAVRFA